MFRPIRFALKLTWRLQLIALAAAAGFGVGVYRQLSEAHRTWGVVPAEAQQELPGDEIITDPVVVETRGIFIDAPPEAVWPWLAQMGYGRGGWYSYDQIDMDGDSADTILDEFQELSEGDLLPTHPGGGFEARTVQPGEALVLYLDTELVGGTEVGDAGAEEVEPPGLQAAGVMGDVAMSEFRGTWAFILEPAAGGRTRLIERMRLWTEEAGMPQRLGLPFMGLGVFVMTRKHMLGLKERAERAHLEG